MDKATELGNLLKPVLDLMEGNRIEIEELVCDIEGDEEIPDKEWDIVDDIGTSFQMLYQAFEVFENKLGKIK